MSRNINTQYIHGILNSFFFLSKLFLNKFVNVRKLIIGINFRDIDFHQTNIYMHLNLIVYVVYERKYSTIGRGTTYWAGWAIYLFYLGWFWTGIGDLDGLIGRQPPGVPFDVNAGVHSGLLLRLPFPSSVSATSSSRDRFPKVPGVTPGLLLGPRFYYTNPQFFT